MEEVRLPLEGRRILTVDEKLPVTYCSMLLADLGAEVIILERPVIGNPSRKLTNYLKIINRNKKSIAVNLQSEQGRQVFYDLIGDCDVIIECMRPGVAAKLGIGYDIVGKLNPQLIYCSVSGYGQDGPYQNWPGHDISYQGVAGMLSVGPRNSEGVPLISSVPIADFSAGMFAVIAVLSSLLTQDRSRGTYIDLSMTDGLISWMSIPLGKYLYSGTEIQSTEGREPAYGVFRTVDGFLTLSIAHEDYFWRNLCISIGRESLASLTRPERLSQSTQLRSELQALFVTRTTAEWVDVLTRANVTCAPVLTLAEVVSDPQIRQRGMIAEIEDPESLTSAGQKYKQVANPIKFSGRRPPIRRLPPSLGQHTEEILKTLDYPPDKIAALRAAGIIDGV